MRLKTSRIEHLVLMEPVSTRLRRRSRRTCQATNRGTLRPSQRALNRFPALALLAVVTLLVNLAAPQQAAFGLGASVRRDVVRAAPSYLSARTANQFASEVLALAPVPIGTRAWRGRLPTGLSQPPLTSPERATDRHRAYLVSAASVSRLRQYVPAHLAGAKWTGSGSGSPPTPDSVDFSMAVAGPHEYSASLSYSMLAAGTSDGCFGQMSKVLCLLRLDAVTVWEPSRPQNEVVPLGDRVALSTYSSVSVDGAPSRSTYTIDLGPVQSRQLVRQFDSMPLGPGASCLEEAVVYKLTLGPASGRGPVFGATGQQCAAVVEVTLDGRPLHSLYDRACALLDLVRSFAPVKATGTRSEQAGCARP